MIDNCASYGIPVKIMYFKLLLYHEEASFGEDAIGWKYD